MMDKERKNETKINVVEVESGFYPSYIYFRIDPGTSEMIKKLDAYTSIESTLKQKKLNYTEINNLHLTISKTFKLHGSEIKKFDAQLAKKLKIINLPFPIIFRKIAILGNFIAFEVSQLVHDKLLPVVDELNTFLSKSNL